MAMHYASIVEALEEAEGRRSTINVSKARSGNFPGRHMLLPLAIMHQ